MFRGRYTGPIDRVASSHAMSAGEIEAKIERLRSFLGKPGMSRPAIEAKIRKLEKDAELERFYARAPDLGFPGPPVVHRPDLASRHERRAEDLDQKVREVSSAIADADVRLFPALRDEQARLRGLAHAEREMAKKYRGRK